jgi:predicted signal transduction protein with EAL and GGDEF domain
VYRNAAFPSSKSAVPSAAIAMARHLNIRVIAEGIEGWQQSEKLRELGCTLAQGHLFAKPAPAHKCERYLTGRPIDLTNRDRRIEPIEVTGITQVQISEMLETGRQAVG